ncbi:Hydroxymethylglutaryl-coa lyase, mitochondrial precursor, partial [Globisporangium splendens]
MGGSNSKTKKASPAHAPPPKSNTQAQVTSKDKAILDLKNARDRLKKYQARLDIEAQQLHESAKKLLQAEKRDRAKLALKVKKFKEQQIKQADEHLLTVLEMLDTVEWETQQLKVFEGLKAGNSILNAIHKEMTVEAVENLMLETEEAQETANEISRLIGGSLTVEDEDSVLLELAEIERLEAEALALVMPEAPTAEPAAIDDDLVVLEDTMQARKAATQAKAQMKMKVKREAIMA